MSCGDVLHRTSNLVISRRCFVVEDVKQICHNAKRSSGACSASRNRCFCSLNMQIPYVVVAFTAFPYFKPNVFHHQLVQVKKVLTHWENTLTTMWYITDDVCWSFCHKTELYTEFENGFCDASWHTNKKHNTLCYKTTNKRIMIFKDLKIPLLVSWIGSKRTWSEAIKSKWRKGQTFNRSGSLKQ